MSVLWQIALHHFKRQVLRRSYLLTLLSMPLFLVFIIGLFYLTDAVANGDLQAGIVDPGAFIQTTSLPDDDGEIGLLFFDDRDTALAGLEREDSPLAAIYVLPADYPLNNEVELAYIESPPRRLQSTIRDILRLNLMAGVPAGLQERSLEGSNLVIRAIEMKRDFPASNPTASFFVPLILAVVYMFAVYPIAGIMLGALGEEKVNRTIEVVMTSVSARTLMAGKVIAVAAIALLQVTVWLLFLVVGVWIGGQVFGIGWLQGIMVPWRDAGVILFLAIPGFVVYAAALVTVGSMVDDAEALAQAGGLVFIPMFLPIYALPSLIEAPNGPLALTFAFLPFTSVQTVGIQSIFMEVPAWRVLSAAGLSWLFAAGMIWLATRAFRIGMLRYGKRIRFRELFARRGGAADGGAQ